MLLNKTKDLLVIGIILFTVTTVLLGLNSYIVNSYYEPVNVPNTPNRLTIYAGQTITYSSDYVNVRVMFDGYDFQVSYWQSGTGMSHYTQVKGMSGAVIFIGKPYTVVTRELTKYVILEETS